MKKIKVMTFLFMCLFIGFATSNVYADVDHVDYKTTVKINKTTYNKYTLIGDDKSASTVNTYWNKDGNIVFCTGHGYKYLNSNNKRTFVKSGNFENLNDSDLDKGIAYATWYAADNGKSTSANNDSAKRVGAQIWAHMLSYYDKYGEKKDNGIISLSDNKLKTQVKSMINPKKLSKDDIAASVVSIRHLYNAHKESLKFDSNKKSIPKNKFDSCTLSDGKYTCTKELKETTGNLLKINEDGNIKADYYYKKDFPSNVKGERKKGSNVIKITAVIDESKISDPVTIKFTRIRLSNKTQVYRTKTNGTSKDLQPMKYSIVKKYTEEIEHELNAEIKKGTVKIKKTIANTNGKTLDGAKLYLYDDKNCTIRSENYEGTRFGVRTTANGGLATWEGIAYNKNETFYIGEAESDDYEKLCVPVKVIAADKASSTEPTVIENIPKGTGSITIEKTNAYTKKPLIDRIFGIYSDDTCETGAVDVDGNELESKTTDAKGIISWDKLPYSSGTNDEIIYYVQEMFSNESTSVGDGYSIDKTADIYKNTKNYCIPVTLKAKGAAFEKNAKKTLKITNIPYGNLTILKQDVDTGVSVKGAVFVLYKSDGKTLAVDIDGKTIDKVTTNSSGVAKFANLPYGDYILKEVGTPSGYKALSKAIKVTLDDNTNSLTYQGQRTIGVLADEVVTGYKLGDVDGDEKVTSKDLQLVKNWVEKINNNEKVTITGTQKYAADVNKDGSLTETDITLFESYLNDGNKLAFNALEHSVFVLGDKTYSLGDPNKDGKVDAKDLEIAQKIYLGENTEYTDLEYYACDLNNDGTVDYNDIDLFEIYLGTGKKSETLDPIFTVDIKKIDYNGDGKYDIKDVYFLKGVLIGKEIALSDFTYDLNGDDQITSDDVTLLESYIAGIGKEKAFDLSNTATTDEQYNEILAKISEYKTKEVSTDTDYLKYDYNKDGKVDNTDLVSVKIDRGEYNVDYNADGKITADDKDLLNIMISGIAKKDDTSYVYDLNSDSAVNELDLAIFTSYIEGDRNLFEKVEYTSDVNGDGTVDQKDLDLVQEAILKKTYSKAADVNGDGVVDSDDIISIKKVIGGLEEFDLLATMVISYEERVSMVVTNIPLDITISKKSIANSKEIEGAVIIIKDSKGKKVLEFESTGKSKKFYLPVGTYTLTEKVAPKGYQKLTNTIKFKMKSDGNVELISAKSNMYKVKKTKTYNETDHLIIYNNPKVIKVPNTGSVKSVIEILGGIALVGAGGYFVYTRYRKPNSKNLGA